MGAFSMCSPSTRAWQVQQRKGSFAFSPMGEICTSFSHMHRPRPASSHFVRDCSGPVSCCARTSAEYTRAFRREEAVSSGAASGRSPSMRENLPSQSCAGMVPLLSELFACARQQPLDCFFRLSHPLCHLAHAALFHVAPKQNQAIRLGEPGKHLVRLFQVQLLIKSLFKGWSDGPLRNVSIDLVRHLMLPKTHAV